MPKGLETLETLVGKPPVDNDNGYALIFFINALGETVQVLPGQFPTDQLNSGNNHYHPSETDTAEVDGFDPYIIPSLQKAQQHLAEMQRGLAHRDEVRRWQQGNAHHFGGYHPWKNKRQRPSIRSLGDSLDDVFSAAKLFGIPYWKLGVTHMRLQEFVGQMGYSNGR